MTYVQDLPNAAFDARCPVIYVDPMINAGTLYVFDPTHPYTAWAAGVPASGALLPNVAASSALALLGSSATADDAKAAYYRNAMTGTAGLAERTGKGGLHGIISQGTLAAPADTAQHLSLSAAANAYMWAHRNDLWYFSMWHRITRAVDPAVDKRSAFAHFTSQDANYLFAMESEGDLPNPGTGRQITNQAAAGNSFRAIGTNGFTVGWGAPTALERARPANWGRQSNWGTGQTANKNPSHILYRATAENLTVSGRSFEAARAADFAEYTKQVLTAGGRYYGDTFTDPTTIP